MAFTRKNVWQQGGTFDDPTILWYARGVKAMKARALNDRTAWRFFGAIHGFNQRMWQQVGYWSPNDPMPSSTDTATFWAQCQHGSWYFLPWHRGYLIALEAMIRDAIANMSGAPNDWALPYWNYFNPNQNALLPAFGSQDWPDGGDNPLYVSQRYGPDSDGNVYVPIDQVDENALGDPAFIGPGQGASQGFGGIKTRFSHGGRTHGGIESQPHDMVHGLVGGGDQQTLGLMSWPDLAGLDPIFYLHHANIDRLWEVWKGMPTAQGDPDNDPDWANGPPNTGGQAFVVPMPGGTPWTYTPGQMSNLSTLNYIYDDTSPPSVTPQALARLLRLEVPAPTAEALVRRTAMAGPANIELLGANAQSMSLSGTEARTSLTLDSSVKNKVTASLEAARTEAPTAAARTAPDRVFLNLENVRGLDDATTFNVYVNVPEGEDPTRHPELKAGSIGLFGVSKATASDGEHAGDGLTYVLDISHIVDALHLSGALDVGQLHVRLVPRKAVPQSAQISIGRISVYRQGS